VTNAMTLIVSALLSRDCIKILFSNNMRVNTFKHVSTPLV
jgi:hypothetical protein